VDVGGNQGGAALSISSRPETQGWKFIVQDRPEVIATKDEIWTEEKKKQVEVEFMAHDFLEVQPVVGAEIYWMRQILHDVSLRTFLPRKLDFSIQLNLTSPEHKSFRLFF